MLRSITTTAGANSRTQRIASWPFAASPTIWTPCSSSRFRRPVRKRSWSSTSRTRSPSVSFLVLSLALWLNASLPHRGTELVKSNRDGPRAPRERLGVRREPEIDAGSEHRPARVGRDSFAVAGNGHLRAEGDHVRVDGDDSVAHRDPRRGPALERVASRRDR